MRRGSGGAGVKGRRGWGGGGGWGDAPVFLHSVPQCHPASLRSLFQFFFCFFFSGTICPREENVTLPCQLSLHPAQPCSSPRLALPLSLSLFLCISRSLSHSLPLRRLSDRILFFLFGLCRPCTVRAPIAAMRRRRKSRTQPRRAAREKE